MFYNLTSLWIVGWGSWLATANDYRKKYWQLSTTQHCIKCNASTSQSAESFFIKHEISYDTKRHWQIIIFMAFCHLVIKLPPIPCIVLSVPPKGQILPLGYCMTSLISILFRAWKVNHNLNLHKSLISWTQLVAIFVNFPALTIISNWFQSFFSYQTHFSSSFFPLWYDQTAWTKMYPHFKFVWWQWWHSCWVALMLSHLILSTVIHFHLNHPCSSMFRSGRLVAPP